MPASDDTGRPVFSRYSTLGEVGIESLPEVRKPHCAASSRWGIAVTTYGCQRVNEEIHEIVDSNLLHSGRIERSLHHPSSPRAYASTPVMTWPVRSTAPATLSAAVANGLSPVRARRRIVKGNDQRSGKITENLLKPDFEIGRAVARSALLSQAAHKLRAPQAVTDLERRRHHCHCNAPRSH